ncbi:MAG: dehydrogenase, partial [Frankiales bacterium]|nr:dehydrogenase [Frankiales bacterium]
MTRAVVVGSGPNGLAAAVALAQRGHQVTVLEAHDQIGGGTRTAELTVPGLQHDVCSAIHPFGIASPYLSSLPLADHGLVWRWPEVDLAHPLDDGTAAVMVRSIDDTAAGLGSDGERWRRMFGPLVDAFDELATDVLGPLLRVPSHPVLMAKFGLRAGLPATVLVRRFATEPARALFTGSAAHAFRPLNGPATAGVGVMLVAAGHRYGWPVAEGGSQAITSALASLLRSLGGTVETGVTVRSLADLPAWDVVLFDTTPAALADIVGDRLPSRRARAYRRFRHGPGAYKV